MHVLRVIVCGQFLLYSISLFSSTMLIDVMVHLSVYNTVQACPIIKQLHVTILLSKYHCKGIVDEKSLADVGNNPCSEKP